MVKAHQKSFHILYMLVDMLLVEAAFILSYFVRFYVFRVGLAPEVKHLGLWEYTDYLLVILAGYLIIFISSGLYESQRTRSLERQLFITLKANAFGVLYVLAVLYLFREQNISRFFLFFFAIINTLLDMLFRMVLTFALRSQRRKGFNLKHVLIVGYSRTAELYLDRVLKNPQWGYSVYGILDDVMAKGTKYKGTEVLGGIDELPVILAEKDLDDVVIALRVERYPELGRIVTEIEKEGLHTCFAPDFQNVMTSDAEIEDLDGIPVINIRRQPLSAAGNRFIKRACDILLSLVGLIVLAIPMLIVAILVKVTSKGPAIFKQTRVGLHNKEFTMYKFRSMIVQDEAEERTASTTPDDRRITKFGAFIRKTSIDELPQLFNVLRGDMSLVGPRPEKPYFVDKYKEEIPRYNVKHQVRPGITGWAQIKGYRGNDTSISKRIECDIWYIENWSLLLDILIMVRTVFRLRDYNAY